MAGHATIMVVMAPRVQWRALPRRRVVERPPLERRRGALGRGSRLMGIGGTLPGKACRGAAEADLSPDSRPRIDVAQSPPGSTVCPVSPVAVRKA
ncbi:hypothetical protein HPB47_010226 [Ixodes persulcatus]|uniref:Uncharacterized protein n=1 Tax=Ixodes persulcatus TaxID=34615 RepID=A0AC60P0C7_IXOPE|nr:hypothetical protein HPB47_010226 [Ixodes persulcatus]